MHPWLHNLLNAQSNVQAPRQNAFKLGTNFGNWPYLLCWKPRARLQIGTRLLKLSLRQAQKSCRQKEEPSMLPGNLAHARNRYRTVRKLRSKHYHRYSGHGWRSRDGQSQSCIPTSRRFVGCRKKQHCKANTSTDTR
jgi:hypothetical protein